METAVKYICVFGFLALLGIANGAGKCGNSTADKEAMNLSPCAAPAQDEHAQVLKFCCIEIEKIGKNPACLCAAMFSKTAKNAGVKPEVAITIPKRCNLVNRPVGYKCGPYTLPWRVKITSHLS